MALDIRHLGKIKVREESSKTKICLRWLSPKASKIIQGAFPLEFGKRTAPSTNCQGEFVIT